MFGRRFFRRFVKVSILGGAFALAACHRCGPEGRAEWISRKVTRYLDLNEEQKAKFQALQAEMKAGREGFHRQARASLAELTSEVKAPRMDPAKLQALLERQQATFNAASPKVIEKLVEFHASLNDEQRAKLAGKLDKLLARLNDG